MIFHFCKIRPCITTAGMQGKSSPLNTLEARLRCFRKAFLCLFLPSSGFFCLIFTYFRPVSGSHPKRKTVVFQPSFQKQAVSRNASEYPARRKTSCILVSGMKKAAFRPPHYHQYFETVFLSNPVSRIQSALIPSRWLRSHSSTISRFGFRPFPSLHSPSG